MRNFRHLSGLTNEEWASLSRKEAPTFATGIVDPASFETFETVASDPAATARMIVKAAACRAAGGPTLPEPSATAKAILAAGERRRGG